MQNSSQVNNPRESGQLSRHTFRTSRQLDFLSEKELTAKIVHPRSAWPLVLVTRCRSDVRTVNGIQVRELKVIH